jgi:hypothetical protein
MASRLPWADPKSAHSYGLNGSLGRLGRPKQDKRKQPISDRVMQFSQQTQSPLTNTFDKKKI